MTHHSPPCKAMKGGCGGIGGTEGEEKEQRGKSNIRNIKISVIISDKNIQTASSVETNPVSERVVVFFVCVFLLSVSPRLCVCQLPYFQQGWDLSLSTGWRRGRVPILIKSGPIRVSSWLKALESVTLRFNPEAFRRRRRRPGPREAAALLKIQIGCPTSGRVARKGRMWRPLPRFNALPRPPFMESLRIVHYH